MFLKTASRKAYALRLEAHKDRFAALGGIVSKTCDTRHLPYL
jgi:hypothetical protein